MSVMTFASTMLKNLFKKPVTKNYPAEPAVYPARSRGHIEIDIEKCISCTLCATNCPSDAIKVDRKAGTWEINRFDCVACGYCVVKCPKGCLTMVPGYQTPGSEFNTVHFQRPAESMIKPAPKAAPAKPAVKAEAKPAADKPAAEAVRTEIKAAGEVKPAEDKPAEEASTGEA